MAFEDLKKSHSVMWGSGPFEKIETYIADMHDQNFELAASKVLSGYRRSSEM